MLKITVSALKKKKTTTLLSDLGEKKEGVG